MEKVTIKRLGDIINEKRKFRKLTMEEVGKLCNVTAPYICKVEQNKEIPNVQCLELLAAALKSDLKLLLFMAYLEKMEQCTKSLKKKYRQ